MSSYLDEGMERWIYVTAHRNYWRVPSWYAKEDLIQDGFVCFAKCQQSYGRLIRKRKPNKDDRRNFMALVRTTYLRHITDLANERTATPERAISQVHHADETSEAWLERNGPVESSMADLAMLIKQAPDGIRALIAAFAGDTNDALEYQRIKLRGQNRTKLKSRNLFIRETTSQYLQRLSKITDKRVDIQDHLRQYFQTEPAPGLPRHAI